MTLDIWLFAAVCFFLLAFCAALRVFSGHILQDRLIAANIATTLGCAGGLALTVSLGELVIPVLAGLIACIIFATTFRISQDLRGEA